MTTTDRPRSTRRDRLATFFAAGLATLPLLAGTGVAAMSNDSLVSPVPEASVSAATTPGVGLGAELIEELREKAPDGR